MSFTRCRTTSYAESMEDSGINWHMCRMNVYLKVSVLELVKHYNQAWELHCIFLRTDYCPNLPMQWYDKKNFDPLRTLIYNDCFFEIVFLFKYAFMRLLDRNSHSIPATHWQDFPNSIIPFNLNQRPPNVATGLFTTETK